MKIIHQGLKPDPILKLNAEWGDQLPQQILIKHNENLVVYEQVWRIPMEKLKFGDESDE